MLTPPDRHLPLTRSSLRHLLRQMAVPVIGTGLAFAFLAAGAFTDLGVGTLRRMLSGPGLRAAALGAGVTALLLVPLLLWQHRRPGSAAGREAGRRPQAPG